MPEAPGRGAPDHRHGRSPARHSAGRGDVPAARGSLRPEPRHHPHLSDTQVRDFDLVDFFQSLTGRCADCNQQSGNPGGAVQGAGCGRGGCFGRGSWADLHVEVRGKSEAGDQPRRSGLNMPLGVTRPRRKQCAVRRRRRKVERTASGAAVLRISLCELVGQINALGLVVCSQLAVARVGRSTRRQGRAGAT